MNVANLVKLLNSGKCGKIRVENLSGLLKVAKLLKIELIKGQKTGGFVKIEAVPALLDNEEIDDDEDDEDEDEKFDLKRVKVECEQSMIEGSDSQDFDSMNDSRFFAEDLDSFEYEEGNKQSKAVCPVCNITCKSWAGMKRHVGHAHRHNKDLTPEERDVIICKCGLSFSKHAKRRVFREHRQKCRDYRNQAVMCKECDLPFLTEGHLKQHYRTSSHKSVTQGH
ncbi:hypothetical protein B4U79_17346 [Dinothrombium tinctorium]|uniref:C2H2-type domain-containing protein n=1 Tax=Dinothrombium tinctorium TaxID=1965070 RepID=A0A443RE96_9ACAR|nr:hypothetical protein B4U79_17347 [Dinothrombium tinctorium]RWS13600.1 hypothetical protein B4U79_17346 [Dinothrombium tinctorium]